MKISNAGLARSTTFLGGLAVIAAVLTVYFIPATGPGSPMQSEGSTFGRILVDSPEVYTRERMVNDRFRQEAWLLKSLNALAEKDLSIQGVVQGQQSRKRSGGLKVASGGAEGEPGSANTPDPVASTSAAKTGDPAQPQLTRIEAFRAEQSAREEIRNAIIENQLDDRHDLSGNTLYRLKFDATVIPGNDTSTWAQVEVKLSRGKLNDLEAEEEELRELFDSWKSDLQAQVENAYDKRISARWENYDQSHIYDAGARYWTYGNVGESLFSDPLVELSNGALDKDAQEDKKCREQLVENLDNGVFRVRAYSPGGYQCMIKVLVAINECRTATSCADWVTRQLIIEDVILLYGSSLGKGKSGPSKSTSRNVAPSEQQRFVQFIRSYGDTVLVQEYVAEVYAVPEALSEDDLNRLAEQQKIYAVPQSLNDLERSQYHAYYEQQTPDDKILEHWQAGFIDCQQVTVRLSDRDFFICDRDLPVFEAAGGSPGIGISRHGQPFFYNESRILDSWHNNMNCQKTTLVQVTDEALPASFIQPRGFFICDRDRQALIHTDSNEITATVSRDAYGTLTLSRKVGFWEFRKKLEKSLDPKFLFSYAVTPRESSQQMASSSRFDSANQLGADAAVGLGDARVDVGGASSSLFSEYAQIMERRPVVVGIAMHGTPKESKEQAAKFGWLIGPKLVTGADGATTYRHLPSQNALAVLVSAPSWWRRADIEIKTSWLDSQGKPDAKAAATTNYTIALPGDTDEITSALLLGGKRPGPIVTVVEPKSLNAGMPAKLLIMGTNLWRSTVVTIGAQRSQRIEVLPNMNGIIAEFEKIDAQLTQVMLPQKGFTQEQENVGHLRVWTSEGVYPSKDDEGPYEIHIVPEARE